MGNSVPRLQTPLAECSASALLSPLNADVVAYLFTFLGMKDRFMLSATCKSFRVAATPYLHIDFGVYSRSDAEKFTKATPQCLRFIRHLDLLLDFKLKTMELTLFKTCLLQSFHNLQSLAIFSHYVEAFHKVLAASETRGKLLLKELEIYHCWSKELTPLKFLAHHISLPTVTTLKLTGTSFYGAWMKFTNQIYSGLFYFPNLEDLTISATYVWTRLKSDTVNTAKDLNSLQNLNLLFSDFTNSFSSRSAPYFESLWWNGFATCNDLLERTVINPKIVFTVDRRSPSREKLPEYRPPRIFARVPFPRLISQYDADDLFPRLDKKLEFQLHIEDLYKTLMRLEEDNDGPTFLTQRLQSLFSACRIVALNVRGGKIEDEADEEYQYNMDLICDNLYKQRKTLQKNIKVLKWSKSYIGEFTQIMQILSNLEEIHSDCSLRELVVLLNAVPNKPRQPLKKLNLLLLEDDFLPELFVSYLPLSIREVSITLGYDVDKFPGLKELHIRRFHTQLVKTMNSMGRTARVDVRWSK